MTMDDITFDAAVRMLHTELGLDPEKMQISSQLYSVHVGPFEIDISGSQKGFFNIISIPGELPRRTTDALTVLLAMNRFQEADPPLHVSLMEESGDSIVIWGRLNLKHATLESIRQLFMTVVETTHSIKVWLDAGAPGLDPKGKSVNRTSSAEALAQRGLMPARNASGSQRKGT